MIKFRIHYNKDKETDWLNRMAKEGYAMTGFFAGFYSFEKCEPGKYTYQIDFNNKLFSVSEDYREFMNEQGVEIVEQWGFWIILRRRTSEGEFELYTDVDSSIEHYTKIRNMFKVLTIIEFICLIFECFAAEAGNVWAIFFAIFIGCLVMVFVNETCRTNRIIRELKERKGEFCEKRNDRMSPMLLCGLLLNCCALIMRESISSPIKITIQILAIIFMIIGLYRSRGFVKN